MLPTLNAFYHHLWTRERPAEAGPHIDDILNLGKVVSPAEQMALEAKKKRELAIRKPKLLPGWVELLDEVCVRARLSRTRWCGCGSGGGVVRARARHASAAVRGCPRGWVGEETNVRGGGKRFVWACAGHGAAVLGEHEHARDVVGRAR